MRRTRLTLGIEILSTRRSKWYITIRKWYTEHGFDAGDRLNLLRLDSLVIYIKVYK